MTRINVHDHRLLTATYDSRNGTHWVELIFTGADGGVFHVCLFPEDAEYAARLADAVNSANVVTPAEEAV